VSQSPRAAVVRRRRVLQLGFMFGEPYHLCLVRED
jgi:hypothetical protein